MIKRLSKYNKYKYFTTYNLQNINYHFNFKMISYTISSVSVHFYKYALEYIGCHCLLNFGSLYIDFKSLHSSRILHISVCFLKIHNTFPDFETSYFLFTVYKYLFTADSKQNTNKTSIICLLYTSRCV